MQHIHLSTCTSTQSHLLDLMSMKSDSYIVSCDEQTDGRGRGMNKWANVQDSVCFSFTASPSSPLTLSSLEMGILICDFFQEFFQKPLKLKWPNDLMIDDGSKCGGILISGLGDKGLVVGIGLNFFASALSDTHNFKTPIGFIFKDHFDFSKKDLVAQIVNYINTHRIPDANKLRMKWNSLCAHLNQTVRLVEDKKEIIGKFIGIGTVGEALIENDEGIHPIYSGSLFLN